LLKWGTIRVTITFDYDRRPWQVDVAENLDRFRFAVVVAHRRAGKTVEMIVHLMTKALSDKRNDARFAYIAPFYTQAKAVAWSYLARYSSPIPGVKVNESELWVEYPNGARITLFGADRPDRLRGIYLDGCVLDEVAQMRPEVWGEIIRPCLADRLGWAVFIGTPKGVNQFFEIFQQAQADDNWFAGSYPVSVTKALPESELDAARKEMSEDQYRQEFECDFYAAVENVLIDMPNILEARKRTLQNDVYAIFPKILGVDVARFGDDRSVIFKRQGKKAFEPLVFQGMDLMALANAVAKEIEIWKPQAVFVDESGVGGGVIDRLRQMSYKQIIGVNFGGKPDEPARYANKRSEMWHLMGKWIDDGADIPDRNDLSFELSAPTYKIDKKDRVLLESKDKLKERGYPSPDLGDGLALTFAHRIQPIDPVQHLSKQEKDWLTITGQEAGEDWSYL
jgi:hypothetical protein